MMLVVSEDVLDVPSFSIMSEGGAGRYEISSVRRREFVNKLLVEGCQIARQG